MATSIADITQQIALSVPYNDETNFSDFCWTGNDLLQQQLMSVLPEKKEQLFYLWGNIGSGKSHLLQASCQNMSQTGCSVAYLPLKLLHDWDPAILEGMADHDLVAVDDIDHVAGRSAWEEALFHLYNRLQAQQNILLVAGQMPPASTTIRLPDLRSRLAYALTLQIHELSDDDKIHTLQGHAKKRGLELPTTVGQYILKRCARNMHDLQAILARLDYASLVAQRKLTIPFVKEVLEV